jgi:hypothetical protein
MFCSSDGAVGWRQGLDQREETASAETPGPDVAGVDAVVALQVGLELRPAGLNQPPEANQFGTVSNP